MQVSPNKARYTVDPDFSDALCGMRYFSLKNSKGSSVIPSTKNFVETYQIKEIQCDDNALCTVCPIESLEMLKAILEKYQESCIFSIESLILVGGNTLVLVVKRGIAQPIFEIRLDLDIFPGNENAISEGSSCIIVPVPIDSSNCLQYSASERVTTLNFFLCYEDVE